MHKYEPQKFNLPSLDGISEKQIDVHLGLYGGYVTHINLLREQIADLSAQDPEKYKFAIESIRRRLGFEFNGMRMHEFYFPQWEGGAREESREGTLGKALIEKYGSWDAFIVHFKSVAMSRGSGWTTLGWDKKGSTPHVWWTADHELGMLTDMDILLTIDMWEHAYMVDYLPAEKAQHVDAFFKNLNWKIAEGRFDSVV
ncbi:MAG: Fe-Mn family superoxide dismutase [Candidatus Pacebacteria bacterium]|nr:Fe-Mn family superoxide dismutase [Candidatus Paceibacterota bacterium]